MLNGGNGIDVSNINSTAFIGSAVDKSGLNGFSVSGSNSVSFTGCDAEENTRAGYYFGASQGSIIASRSVINNKGNVGGYGNYVIDTGSNISIYDSNDDNHDPAVTAIASHNNSLAFVYSGYYIGAMIESSGGAIVKAGSLGLFCTGAPSGSFTVKGGIVTHC